MKHLRPSVRFGMSGTREEARSAPRLAPSSMPEPRVVRATWLSSDRKVILVAVGPDNCERYRVKCEPDEVERVSELMWRDTEELFPSVMPPSDVGGRCGSPVGRGLLSLLVGDVARDLEKRLG